MPTDPEFLQDFSCFRTLPEDKLKTIAQFANAVCYLPGHTLFNEGEPGKYLYFLINGDIEVLYNIGEDGQVQVNTISGQEIAGCSALIEPYTYTATERSLTEIEVLEIDAPLLRELMQQDSELEALIQQNIIQVLMERILDLRLQLASK
jgi:CRP/FNR family cyclic AMP-dependent transcriptional regulator